MFKCTPVNGKKKKKKVLQTVHMFGMLIYISFLFGLVLRFSRGGWGLGVGGVVVTESFQTVLNRNRIMDETEAHDTNTQLYNFPYFIQFD